MERISYDINYKNNTISRRKINYGIQILRMILAFLFLTFHCFNKKLAKNKFFIVLINGVSFYVPAFFIMSYYFSFHIVNSKNIQKMKMRIKRLFIPYIIWPFVFFLIDKIIQFFNHKYRGCTINDLIIQLLIGKRINRVFWFQCNLIFTLIFAFILSLIISEFYLLVIQSIGIIGYYYYSFYINNYMISFLAIYTPSSSLMKTIFLPVFSKSNYLTEKHY